MTVSKLAEEHLRAQIAALAAERAKNLAEEQANLAIARLRTAEALSAEREIADEDASADRQRIFDFTDEVGKISVRDCINTLTEWRAKSEAPITVRFVSPGGNVFHGMALFDYILSLRGEGIAVNTVALGYAASMAGILLQAGTTRYIGPNSYLLIHEISSLGIGKTSELEDEVKLMKRLQDRVVAIFLERSAGKISKAAFKLRWERKDWWPDAEECLHYGFADKIGEHP